MTHKAAELMTGFGRSLDAFPDRPALMVDDEGLTYRALWRKAEAVARIVASAPDGNHPLAAVFASRSQAAYAGILGVLAAGRGYVPLNKRFPSRRSRAMLNLSGCRTVVVGPESMTALLETLEDLDRRLTLVFPTSPPADRLAEIKERYPRHDYRVIEDNPVRTGDFWQPSSTLGDTAYLMFTSGSTGVPKGVPVSHGNAVAYVEYVSRRYNVMETDRFSQTFDLTFDLSVHDLFVAWSNGACLCSVPETSVMAPGKFIKDQKLTMWFSVPSTAMFMSRLHMLKPGSFPSLRWSLFCGEPLPEPSARLWQAAAPNSSVENLYGPTEATIAITHYRWDPEKSPGICQNGIVPIGTPFHGQKACLADEQGLPVAEGQSGELCLSGSQVTGGYLDDPEKTAERFQYLPACGPDIWYRTGDLVSRDESGCYHYLCRMDQQVQILGYRVELQEVEFRLKEVLGADAVACVPWPLDQGPVRCIYAFAAGTSLVDEKTALDYCRRVMPEYMVPQKIYALAAMPLNLNGKVDRKQLAGKLKEIMDE